MWSTLDLRLVMRLFDPRYTSAVTCLAFANDNDNLLVGDEGKFFNLAVLFCRFIHSPFTPITDGRLMCWSKARRGQSSFFPGRAQSMFFG
jgi:hypothetical protein